MLATYQDRIYDEWTRLIEEDLAALNDIPPRISLTWHYEWFVDHPHHVEVDLERFINYEWQWLSGRPP